MKRVLSIDGGGIRGLIPAVVCEHIEKESGEPIHKLFNLIAGTSTGGIIAMGLALPPTGKPASELVDFYRDAGPKIFSRPRGRSHYFRHPKFSNTDLADVMRSNFGEATISNALTEVLITSYDIKYREHFNISSRVAKESKNKDKEDHLMWRIAMGTSAAPTYFTPSELGDRVLIDGGIVANNPACLALAEARQLWGDETILLVSLGTGTLTRPIQYARAAKWGLIGWARPLIDCMFDGTAKATESFLNYTMDGEQYWRFQFGLNEGIEALDGVSEAAIDGLISIGRQIVENNKPRFKRLIELLKQNSDHPEPAPGPHTIETKKLLAVINDGVEKSLSIRNRIFGLGVNNKLYELYKSVRDWERGIIRVPADDEGRFLVDLYAEAKSNVFSTRLKQFSGVFEESSLPDDILKANQKSAASVTRVFVFDTDNDASVFDFREMVRQQGANIDVRVLIRSTKSMANSIEDFTIIDEYTVGVTEFVGPRAAAGRWMFDDELATRPFIQMKAQLLSESTPFAQWVEEQKERKARYNLWTQHELVSVSERNIGCYQELSKQFFGDDAADDDRLLTIQRQVGRGIFLLRRCADLDLPTVGILSLVPVSFRGFGRLERGEVKGSSLSPDDIRGAGEIHAPGYYLGAIAGTDARAKAALVDAFDTFVHQLRRERVHSMFARPVTDDGLRFLKAKRWLGPNGTGQPMMHRVCRFRL